MAVLAKFPATASQFVKDNNTDVVNLVLGWAVFWIYGFRTLFFCGYTSTQTLSQYYCDEMFTALSACAPGDAISDSCTAAIESTPKFAQKYTVDLYKTCFGDEYQGSLSPYGNFCSGQNGTGEFIVTLLLMILVTVVFFWKMAKFIHCPDKLERKRRKEVMLKDFLLSQNSTK